MITEQIENWLKPNYVFVSSIEIKDQLEELRILDLLTGKVLDVDINSIADFKKYFKKGEIK